MKTRYLLFACITVLTLLAGFQLRSITEARSLGALEISVLDQDGGLVSNVCVRVFANGQDIRVCDQKQFETSEDVGVSDIDAAIGKMRVGDIVGNVPVRLDSYPPNCVAAAGEPSEQRVMVLGEQVVAIQFHLFCSQGASSGTSDGAPESIDPLVVKLEAKVAELEERIKLLEAEGGESPLAPEIEKVAELEERIKLLEAEGGESQLPPELEIGTNVVIFGGMIYSSGGLEPDKSIYLLCQPLMETRPPEVFIQCGWISAEAFASYWS